ncbi:GNAT family N-acetyltransferase [Halalkalibacter akibai]|uniref:RibT protein n=1 Tax=Halalkalibacter akibai (strain ATCC 43226 / DSM 21942 / CIP 109018 / JCM 9157 / 1139) TaxID=1236973 RepID=W4QWZ0_HALA3|nr:GNAT family N-acetyltransferase [Halalkalibacter akibai]GAE35839.1 RibT protein [Halalkalibacter akibai JCM 9157]
MLVPYKTTNQKIAMGLLSFMPEEKDVKKLLKTIERYDSDPNWKLYLWKKEDFVGVIGIFIKEDRAYLEHVCVNPSFRHEGIGRAMLNELRRILPCELSPTSATRNFMIACSEEEKSS